MSGFARSHWIHHGRFYACLLLGAAVYAAAGAFAQPVRWLAFGDSFFLSYVAIMATACMRLSAKELDKKAEVEDEGIVIVVLVSVLMIGLSVLAVFTLLHQKQAVQPLAVALAVLAAPLGWFMLHMLMAFHYAYLFYSEPGKKPGGGLEFPEELAEPGAGDFLYYSFVVGMTAQVSDVQVTSRRIRRMTLGHGIVSFFFNTVLIAMAVNAVVAQAS